MLNRLRDSKVSFQHAFHGFSHMLKMHPNFRFHLFATALVILLGSFFQISILEWLVVVFTINMVLVAEMINTSIEAMVDLITLEHRQDAKIAKDVAAGMVLVSAVLALVIALLIFLPRLITLFF